MTKSLHILLIICFTLLGAHSSRAQSTADTSLNNIITDTLHERKASDTVKAKYPPLLPAESADDTGISARPHLFQPNPKKAGLYSALLPGLGQLYNRQYWKVPLIYAGLGVAGYFFIDNLNNYQSYRKAYIGRINNPYPTDEYVNRYSTPQLQQLQSDYDRYLDLTVLFSSLGYILNVIDAITSAHLKNFDISRDISMHVLPVATPYGAGIGIVMNFK